MPLLIAWWGKNGAFSTILVSFEGCLCLRIVFVGEIKKPLFGEGIGLLG